ncbi:MAG: DUF1501 domain-containing protein [Pirellulaceae bacterium]
MRMHNVSNDCGSRVHVSRRSLLQGMGAMSLSSLAVRLGRAEEAAGRSGKERPKSVIVLWLKGAPSQYETFDPHPGTKYGGEVKAIDTTVPDLRISEFLPRTAEQMHRVALVRSVTGKEGDHQRAIYNMQTGWRPDPTVEHPAIGAIVCHELEGGADIPRHITILPDNTPGRGGYLGAKYDAFKVYDPASRVPDVEAFTDKERFERRIDRLTSVVEKNFARGRLQNLDSVRTLHQVATASAKTMMTSDQLSAFEVDKESKQTIAGFGDTPFGRGCLAAVRLIEVGVRCVEVGLSGWDTHADNHNGQKTQCDILDPAYAALLSLLAERDLLDSTLVVCGGEFGRTPQINPLAGRDHWPHGFSIALAGCGLRSGVVHGATSPNPKLEKEDLLSNVADPVTVADIHATILKALGVEFDRELITPIGRPLRLSDGKPIESILL